MFDSIIFALGEVSDVEPEGEDGVEGEEEGEDGTPVNIQCNGSGLGATGSSSWMGDFLILLVALTMLIFLPRRHGVHGGK